MPLAISTTQALPAGAAPSAGAADISAEPALPAGAALSAGAAAILAEPALPADISDRAKTADAALARLLRYLVYIVVP